MDGAEERNGTNSKEARGKEKLYFRTAHLPLLTFNIKHAKEKGLCKMLHTEALL
jgi:hypothetical protein